MKCIICRKLTRNDEDICYTCRQLLKHVAKNPKQLIEYFRKKNENR